MTPEDADTIIRLRRRERWALRLVWLAVFVAAVVGWGAEPNSAAERAVYLIGAMTVGFAAGSAYVSGRLEI